MKKYLNLASVPFILLHILGLAAFFSPFSLKMLLLVIFSYYFRMLFITLGYHRYFAHRSFKTSRVFQFVLAFLAQTSAQKGALWWAAHHRHHHKFSDKEEDIHSVATSGFFHAHVGWIMNDDHSQTDWKYIGDFAKFPELVFLNKYFILPPTIYAIVIFMIFGLPGLMWGFFFSTMILYHGTFFINSLAHVLGKKVYDSKDESRNSMILALLTCGEGWHSNHHHFQAAAKQGWHWWQVDFSYYLLKSLKLMKIVSDIRAVPDKVKMRTLKMIASEQKIA